MLKKIALVGIFAVTSVFSFGSSTVNARQSGHHAIDAEIQRTVLKGWCPGGCR
jgi:hypothetical protein